MENIESKAEQFRKLHDTGMPIGRLNYSVAVEGKSAKEAAESFLVSKGLL